MAAKVVTRKKSGPNNPEKSDTYNDAMSFQIQEGHLMVLKQDGLGTEYLGLYAPGEWVKAYVVDAMA